jgi:hypothetical protein
VNESSVIGVVHVSGYLALLSFQHPVVVLA